MEPKPHTLVLAAHGTQRIVLQRLEERYRVARLGSLAICQEILRLGSEEISNVSVLVTPGGNQIPHVALERLPNLRLIACTSSGYDGVDMHSARALNIAVTNCPEVNASSVAEVAIGLLIANMRRIFEANQILRTSGFLKPWPITTGLSDRRAGIYGLGAIGAKVARRLVAMEMEVGYCARSARANAPYAYFEDVISLARWSDALIICVPATEQTVKSIDSTVLSALGPGGYLVNVSRASVVDTEILCTFLERQAIAGAGLDVCEAQYVPRLLMLPNATLTPHIGGSTAQAEAAMCDLVLRNVAAHFVGTNLLTPVVNETGAQMETVGGPVRGT